MMTTFQRAWPPAFLVLGAVITMAWTVLLGYGLVQLLQKAM